MNAFARRHSGGDAMHFEAFVREAVSEAPGSDHGLSCDELFGLYTSWCLLSGRQLLPEQALWRALKRQGIAPRQKQAGNDWPRGERLHCRERTGLEPRSSTSALAHRHEKGAPSSLNAPFL